MDDQVQAILQELYDSVLDGDVERAADAARASLGAGIPPLTAIDQGLTPGIKEVGDRFGRMDMFLPEMVMSAKAMDGAVAVLAPHFAASDRPAKGRILIGTVKGDVHDIGKNIVIALLKVNGFEVIDLGRDIPPTTFVDQAKQVEAQIVGMSGLLTTSLPMMRETIQTMVDDGVRNNYKVIIGGGPSSQEFAETIGADGYADDAHEAVQLCNRLVGC